MDCIGKSENILSLTIDVLAPEYHLCGRTDSSSIMTEAAGAVIGINLGQSYGSIACINQHGRADVIANEDGERQIATRMAFDDDQIYMGNQATPQLVRNAPNAIDRFVNLLGRR